MELRWVHHFGKRHFGNQPCAFAPFSIWRWEKNQLMSAADQSFLTGAGTTEHRPEWDRTNLAIQINGKDWEWTWTNDDLAFDSLFVTFIIFPVCELLFCFLRFSKRGVSLTPLILRRLSELRLLKRSLGGWVWFCTAMFWFGFAQIRISHQLPNCSSLACACGNHCHINLELPMASPSEYVLAKGYLARNWAWGKNVQNVTSNKFSKLKL